MTTKQKLLAFGPALLVIGATALTASGLSMVGGATAASSISVTGTVDSSIATDPTVVNSGDCTAGAMDFGNSWAAAAVVRSGCGLSYVTNDPGGANVSFINANGGATGEPAVFCNDPAGAAGRDCANGQVTDLSGTGNTLTNPDSFGLALASSTGPADNDPGAGVATESVGAPTAGQNIWAGIPASNATPAELCATGSDHGGVDAVCTIAVGVHGAGAAAQQAGDYTGTINFTAQDNN